MHRRAVETTQVACVAELEMENSKLLAELQQTRAAFTEANTARNPLSLTQGKLEEECMSLRAVIESLG
jgi:hypothetical protein